MTRRMLHILIIVASCAGAGCATTQQDGGRRLNTADQEPTSFEAAQLQARRAEADPATLEWRRKTIAGLGRALSVIEPCSEGIAPADVPTVNVAVRLSFQGRATRVFTAEGSTYAKCIGERLLLLDLGSAPWEGYWYDVRLAGAAESLQTNSQVLSFAGEPCVPGSQGAAPTEPTLVITRTNPSSGSSVDQRTQLSISMSYSLPASSAEQYKLMVIFEATTPGRAIGMGPINFPYPVTCGPRGSIVATMPVASFWNLPELSSPMKIRLAVVTATGFRVIAQSEAMEYSKQ